MIYILKFEHKLGNPENRRAQAQYYVGSCDDNRLIERLAEHRRGEGACITRACVERGIRLELVAILPGGWEQERAIKAYKNTPKLLERLQRDEQKVMKRLSAFC